MTIKYLIPSVAALSLLNSGCMTSEKWVDDDVYVMKSVELPTDTDVTDETDYSSFVFNQRHNRGRIDYYNSFNMTNRPMWASPGYIIGGTYYSPYYHMGLYNPCGYYSAFGYYYGYNPNMGYDPYMGYNHYYGWGYPGYGYGYNPYNYYGQNNGNVNWNNQPKPGIHVSGPRGGISGYGGIRSNSPYAYKSAPVVNNGTNPSGKPVIAQRQVNNQPVRTVSKPVASYDRVGKEVATTRPTSSGQTSGRTVTPTTHPVSGRQVSTVSGRTSSPQVVRPASTTARTENRPGAGTTYTSGRTGTTTRPVSTGTTSSPQRQSSDNGSSGSSRVNSGSSSAGSSRSNSGTSSGSSSSPRSGSSSSGGSHSSGRRP